MLDPVCGMEIDPASAAATRGGGVTYYFCSQQCAEQFDGAAGGCAVKEGQPAAAGAGAGSVGDNWLQPGVA